MTAPSLHGLAMNRMRPFALCSLLLCKLLAPILAQVPEGSGSLLEHREAGFLLRHLTEVTLIRIYSKNMVS